MGGSRGFDFGVLFGGTTFLGIWTWACFAHGFLGFAIGWMPAAIIGAFVFLVSLRAWGLILGVLVMAVVVVCIYGGDHPISAHHAPPEPQGSLSAPPTHQYVFDRNGVLLSDDGKTPPCAYNSFTGALAAGGPSCPATR